MGTFLEILMSLLFLFRENTEIYLLLSEVILAYVVVAVFESMATLIKSMTHMAVVLLKT